MKYFCSRERFFFTSWPAVNCQHKICEMGRLKLLRMIIRHWYGICIEVKDIHKAGNDQSQSGKRSVCQDHLSLQQY